ncbi:RidA family protein [Bordetella sp. 02P26C-1]|uniref:RidA family protein n=1 Tax=Bordetella sp. 02P26C-1 TaxID=2683195 RepID=UPI0013538B63|nr:Rid family hydrolase [Bordetella sp. 02P26C-1]MVW78652.1 RidA family protein [Bordetella sp. 02P26C-1]
MSIERYESPLGLPFSRMIRAGGFVFFSGQIPMDSNGQVVRGDIKTQTAAVMERLRDSLAEVGLGFEDVIKATVWLSDLAMFAEFNEVYRTYFAAGLPVRSTVEAKLAMGVDLEIEIQALDR